MHAAVTGDHQACRSPRSSSAGREDYPETRAAAEMAKGRAPCPFPVPRDEHDSIFHPGPHHEGKREQVSRD